MNNVVLKNKKILFICPNFIGYNNAIKIEIENLGGQVLMFNDRPYNGVYDFFKKLNINIIKAYQDINWYYRLIKIDLKSYNTLFVIRGEHVPLFVFDKCKKAGLDMVMYQWDSIKNHDYLNQRGFFDKISTFDSEDSKKYGFQYFPLFYRREYTELKIKKSKSKTALFVGTFQMARYNSVLELVKRLDGIGISSVIKIKIPLYYFFKLKLKGIVLDKKYLVFENISFSKMLNLYSNADIIIDAASENQSGLTMRTFEALGANKYLLTNNKSIIEEPFFDSKSIKFFDQQFLHETFLDGPSFSLAEKQRLDNWINKLLN